MRRDIGAECILQHLLLDLALVELESFLPGAFLFLLALILFDLCLQPLAHCIVLAVSTPPITAMATTTRDMLVRVCWRWRQRHAASSAVGATGAAVRGRGRHICDGEAHGSWRRQAPVRVHLTASWS